MFKECLAIELLVVLLFVWILREGMNSAVMVSLMHALLNFSFLSSAVLDDSVK